MKNRDWATALLFSFSFSRFCFLGPSFMKLLLIANPRAGRGRSARLWPAIRDRMEATGHQVQSVVSRSAEHVTDLARAGVERRVDAVVACGGDGTIHQVLQALVPNDLSPPGGRKNVALGLIPTGTGNDLARSLGLPTDWRKACEIMDRGRTRLIDVARVEKESGDPPAVPYVSVAAVGFDAEVNRLADRSPAWCRGRVVYISAVLRALARFTPQFMEVEYDGGRFAGEAMLVAVGNARSYGGGLKIVPQAELDDGWLDLCIVKKASRLELLPNLPRLYRGTHVHHPAVEIHQARHVRLASAEAMALVADGEYVHRLPVIIDVAPRALRVIVP